MPHFSSTNYEYSLVEPQSLFSGTRTGTVDNIFRTSKANLQDGLSHAEMKSGTWVGTDSGSPTAGAIGVLMDTVLGSAAMQNRPKGFWAVTTQLSLQFARALPMDGSTVRGEASCLTSDSMGAMSSGRAYDAAGNMVVAGSTWIQFTPGIPHGRPSRFEESQPHELPQSMSEILDLIPTDSPTRLFSPANTDLLNPHGALHGGAVIALAERAASQQPIVVGMEIASLSTTYLRPGKGDLTVDVSQVHGGRSLQLLEIAISDATGRMCSKTSAMYRRNLK